MKLFLIEVTERIGEVRIETCNLLSDVSLNAGCAQNFITTSYIKGLIWRAKAPLPFNYLFMNDPYLLRPRNIALLQTKIFNDSKHNTYVHKQTYLCNSKVLHKFKARRRFKVGLRFEPLPMAQGVLIHPFNKSPYFIISVIK